VNQHLSNFRVESQFDPVERTNQGGSSQKVASELVIAGGDTPPILDAAEKIFDLVGSV
jgi:hypothetical protein